MVTGEQLRAALAALRWSRRILHTKCNVSERTIQRAMEASGIPGTNARTLAAIQAALEEGNDEGYIEFTEDGAPGIKFHRKTEENFPYKK